MNTILWILQIALSVKFITVALSHGVLHNKQTMQQAIQTMGKGSTTLLVIFSIVIFASSLGLILPAAAFINIKIVSISAAILAGLTLLSIAFHINCRENPKIFASVIIFVIATFIMYGRWAIKPL